MDQQLLKLDLGCGNLKPTGYIGIDKVLHGNVVDIIKDLDDPKLHLDFQNNSVAEIRAFHLLEHIHHLFPLMNECHRILAPTGTFEIIVPSAESPMAFGDPTHVRFFTGETFHYFLSTPPGNYHNPEIIGTWKIVQNDWTPFMEEDTEKIILHKRRELHVILQPEKGDPGESLDNSTKSQ